MCPTAAGVALYHVISRTNNKQFLFNSPKTKDVLADVLKRVAAFSGVEIEAYAIMDNHVHVVVKVMRPAVPYAHLVGSVPKRSFPYAKQSPKASVFLRSPC